MALLNLNDPTNGTVADATLIATNNSSLKSIINGGLDNGNVASGAGIAYSKLDLSGGIVNADISASAAIAASKLAGYPTDNTKFLDGSGNWTVPAGGGSGTTITTYRKTTTKTVVSSTTATDLLNGEITIGAGVMGTTGTLKLRAWGDLLINAGSTPSGQRFQVVFGGTTLIDTNTTNGVTLSATRGSWWVEVDIANLGAANSQTTRFRGMIYAPGGLGSGGGSAFTTGKGANARANINGVDYQGINTGTSVNTANSCALVLNVINGVNSASYDTVLYSASVEVI